MARKKAVYRQHYDKLHSRTVKYPFPKHLSAERCFDFYLFSFLKHIHAYRGSVWYNKLNV